MASLLNVGKHSVFRLAKTGELASYHVGRKLRFTQAGVASYISAQTSQTNRANVGEVPACAPSILKTTTSAASSSGFAGATTFASTPFVIAGTELAGDIFANLIAISSLNASDPASFVSDIPFGLNGSLTLDGASALGNSFSLNGASGVQVSSGVHVSRLYVNDYSALLNLYSGKANAAI